MSMNKTQGGNSSALWTRRGDGSILFTQAFMKRIRERGYATQEEKALLDEQERFSANQFLQALRKGATHPVETP